MAAEAHPESEELSFLATIELPKKENKFSVDWPVVEKSVKSASIYLKMTTKEAMEEKLRNTDGHDITIVRGVLYKLQGSKAIYFVLGNKPVPDAVTPPPVNPRVVPFSFSMRPSISPEIEQKLKEARKRDDVFLNYKDVADQYLSKILFEKQLHNSLSFTCSAKFVPFSKGSHEYAFCELNETPKGTDLTDGLHDRSVSVRYHLIKWKKHGVDTFVIIVAEPKFEAISWNNAKYMTVVLEKFNRDMKEYIDSVNSLDKRFIWQLQHTPWNIIKESGLMTRAEYNQSALQKYKEQLEVRERGVLPHPLIDQFIQQNEIELDKTYRQGFPVFANAIHFSKGGKQMDQKVAAQMGAAAPLPSQQALDAYGLDALADDLPVQDGVDDIDLNPLLETSVLPNIDPKRVVDQYGLDSDKYKKKPPMRRRNSMGKKKRSLRKRK